MYDLTITFLSSSTGLATLSSVHACTLGLQYKYLIRSDFCLLARNMPEHKLVSESLGRASRVRGKGAEVARIC